MLLCTVHLSKAASEVAQNNMNRYLIYLTVKMAVLYWLLSLPATLTDFNCFKRPSVSQLEQRKKEDHQ
jgi:hypothetical protein